MVEYRVSRASTISIITAFTSSTVDWYLLQLTFHELWHQNTKCSFLKVPEIKSYILSRGHSVFEGRFFFWRFVSRSDTPKFRKQISRLLCEDYRGKLTTLLEPLHGLMVNCFPTLNVQWKKFGGQEKSWTWFAQTCCCARGNSKQRHIRTWRWWMKWTSLWL